MCENPSLLTRIAIGKLIGLVFGLIGFMCLPYFLPDADGLLRWGLLLWYTTVGAIIGVFGVLTYHPMLTMPLPWWFRAPLVGGWMNFVLVFFAHDAVQSMMITLFGEHGWLSSPFWFVLEGALIGLCIDFCATRYGGEGKKTLET